MFGLIPFENVRFKPKMSTLNNLNMYSQNEKSQALISWIPVALFHKIMYKSRLFIPSFARSGGHVCDYNINVSTVGDSLPYTLQKGWGGYVLLHDGYCR